MMTTDMRNQLEQLIDQAWDLHDQAETQEEKEMFKTDIMELLSKLPENVEILKIMQ